MAGNGEPVAPTGEQHEISFGRQRAVVVQVGGGLRSYEVDDAAVLDGFAADEMASSARGCPLIPWPNRLHEGRYRWDGGEQQTPINEPDKRNALHGFTRFMNWTATDHVDDSVTMVLRLHGQQGYPFVLDLWVRYALDDDGLTVTTGARNVGGVAAPYAMGAHPYLTAGTERIDDALLQLPAATYLPTDESQIPTGRLPVEGTRYDFRTPREIGDTQMDYAFTDLERDAQGNAWLELSHPGGDRRVRLWADEHFPYLEVFTGDTVPEAHRRRRGLGAEPMTCPPNAFQTGQDVHRLEPGEELVCRWGITPMPR